MDDAKLIAEVGQALWGPAWKGPMAEAVRHQKSAVADWASGRLPVPAGVWSELKKLMRSAGTNSIVSCRALKKPMTRRCGARSNRRSSESEASRLHSAAFGIAACCMRKTCSQPR